MKMLHEENEFMKFYLFADVVLVLFLFPLSNNPAPTGGFWCLKILLKHEKLW
jgi:hypothetical protein